MVREGMDSAHNTIFDAPWIWAKSSIPKRSGLVNGFSIRIALGFSSIAEEATLICVSGGVPTIIKS